MPRVSLLGGSYSSRSLIANAQRCINLFPEATPEESGPPTPVVHLLTPGLTVFCNPNPGFRVRGLHRVSSTGDLIAVVGSEVYKVSNAGVATHLGTISGGGALTVPVAICDNGIVVVIADGFFTDGWVINIATMVMTQITDPAFLGANSIAFLDGFLVFNRPQTNQFYLSPPFWDGVTAFDGTYIASKTGGPDPITCVAVVGGNLWLIGLLTTEVWYNSGAQDFPFERQPGVFIGHGTNAAYSVAPTDVELFFLNHDQDGRWVVFKTEGYSLKRVSTHAVENSLLTTGADQAASYGYTYQEEGHTFYVLNCQQAGQTWVYDLATGQWHQRTWTDPGTGVQSIHRGVNHAFCFSSVHVVGDYANGIIYAMSQTTGTDNGAPITRTRGLPHLVKDGKRLSHSSLILDMDVSQVAAGSTVSLRWSDDRGSSWGTPLTLTIANSLSSLLLRRLGMARDRVYEVSWTFAYQTSLQGAWLEVERAAT